MDIETGWRQILPYVGLRFSDFIPPEDMVMMLRNKGRAGQLMEKAIGLQQSTSLLDFEDGDLKTFKSREDAYPLETMAIHQFGDEVDDLVKRVPFRETPLHRKTARMIVLAICKVPKSPQDWFITNATMIDARPETTWFKRFQLSYSQVLDAFHAHLSKDGRFHTSNGDYIQIRTKDSKPYHPVFSRILNKELCNKRIAFYFRKSFMKELFHRT